MLIGAGNPILTTPNGQQLDKAFENLDFVVAVDFYITETSRHADIILPPVTALESAITMTSCFITLRSETVR